MNLIKNYNSENFSDFTVFDIRSKDHVQGWTGAVRLLEYVSSGALNGVILKLL